MLASQLIELGSNLHAPRKRWTRMVTAYRGQISSSDGNRITGIAFQYGGGVG